MSGFLGYDPGRLAALRRAVAAALAEAATVRCPDPLAAEPLLLWRRAIALVEPWDARLGAILSCGFASPYQPVAPGPVLPIDDLRLLNPAWTVTTDPVDGAPAVVDPLERLDELVALLVNLDPARLGDPASLARLLELLDATFADDAARRRWFEALGPDGFAALVVGLARWVATGLPGDQVSAGATAVVSRLARGLGVSVARGEVDETAYRGAALDGTYADQYAAALVLRGAAFPSAVTAAWARDVLSRERAFDPAGLDTQVPAGQPHAGELVLAALTADPVAGRRVVLALDELDVLLGPHLDGDRRGRFLLTAVDPARFPVDETVTILQHVLGYLESHRSVAAGPPNTRDLRNWLGPCIAPYLLRVVPSPSVPIADWGSTDAAEVLIWVSESPLSAAALLASVHALVGQALPMALSGPPGDIAVHVQQSMEQLGVAQGAIERGQALWAKTVHDDYDKSKTLTKLVFGQAVTKLLTLLVPPAGVVTSTVGDVFTPMLVDKLYAELDERGIIEAPPTEDEMAGRLARQGAELELTALYGGVATAYARLVATGALPAGTPPPRPDPCLPDRTYLAKLDAWAAALGPRGEGLSALTTLAAASFATGRATVPGPPPRAPLDGFDSSGRIDAARKSVRRMDKALLGAARSVISEP